MTPADIIYSRRCHVIERAAIVGVSRACREAGVSRTSYYRWCARASRYGLSALVPKLEHLAERGVHRSGSGVHKVLHRHHLGTRKLRVAALAALTAADTGLVAPRALGPYGFCLYASRPGDLVGLDCFYVGKLKGIGPVWQLTAVDTCTRWAFCSLMVGHVSSEAMAAYVKHLGTQTWKVGMVLRGVLSDNGPASCTATTPPGATTATTCTAGHRSRSWEGSDDEFQGSPPVTSTRDPDALGMSCFRRCSTFRRHLIQPPPRNTQVPSPPLAHRSSEAPRTRHALIGTAESTPNSTAARNRVRRRLRLAATTSGSRLDVSTTWGLI